MGEPDKENAGKKGEVDSGSQEPDLEEAAWEVYRLDKLASGQHIG